MPKLKSKEVVDAVKYTGENHEDIYKFDADHFNQMYGLGGFQFFNGEKYWRVHTKEGVVLLQPGTWLVTDERAGYAVYTEEELFKRFEKLEA